MTSDIVTTRKLVALRNRCVRVAEAMLDAAGAVLEKGHDNDAAVQYDTATEIREALRDVRLEDPLVCADCGTEESDEQFNLDLDCKCGGPFVERAFQIPRA